MLKISLGCKILQTSMSYIDSCCFDCFLRNSLVALLEALFAQVMHTKGGCDVQMRRI